MHENCKAIFQKHCVEYFVNPNDRVLEIGPAYPTPSWYETTANRKFDTCDMNRDRRDVTYHAGPHCYDELPSYNIVFCGMTLEHTPKPWLWIQGVSRIVHPGGRLIVIAPFTGPEHGDDYFRFLPKGLTVLANTGGFVVEHVGVYEYAKGDWRGPDTEHADSLLIARKP